MVILASSTAPTHDEPSDTDKVLRIYVGHTYFTFRCSRYGKLSGGLNISSFVKRNLTEYTYSHRYRRYVLAYQYSKYLPELGMARLPRYILDDFICYIGDIEHEIISLDCIEPRVVDMSLKDHVNSREHQKDIIEFLSTDEAFKPIGVFTGGGKSFMAVAGIVMKKHPAVIVLPGLISQWYKTILDFTTMTKDDIFVVQGFHKLCALIAMVNMGHIPSIVIFSTRTLVMYCSQPSHPYDQIMSFEELMTKIGVGTKVIDEVHMNFNANVLIDLQSNIKYNVYLSATYQRTNPVAKKIFDKVFPDDKIYGDAIGKKYTVVYLCSYRLSVEDAASNSSTANGYNHALYEKCLLKDTNAMEEFVHINLMVLVNNHYLIVRKPGQKLLILCATRNMAIALGEKIPSKDMTIGVFFSGDASYGNESVFTECDCIISTHKSCGTGRDIKNLKTCINTLSFASAPLANQVMGRLRELPGEETYFVDMYNEYIPAHMRHISDRRNVYLTKAKTLHTFKLS